MTPFGCTRDGLIDSRLVIRCTRGTDAEKQHDQLNNFSAFHVRSQNVYRSMVNIQPLKLCLEPAKRLSRTNGYRLCSCPAGTSGFAGGGSAFVLATGVIGSPSVCFRYGRK